MIELQRRLADELTASGALPDAWRSAFDATPRHLFIPDVIWDDDNVPVVQGEDPQAWAELVYSNAPVTTQLDDGATAPVETGGYYSSSSSMPSVMFRMLEELDVHDGCRVLEIGTGTGWNAALLARRLGDVNLTTLEVDQAVADHARRVLRAAGLGPRVVTGDGAAGHPAGAPFDRVLATCAVWQVPQAWVDQTRPGGRIVTPWGTPFYNGALLTLTVTGEGTAEGTIVGTSAFMWLRQQRTPYRWLPSLRTDADTIDHETDLHPYEPLTEPAAALAIGILTPGCQQTVVHDDNGDPQHYTVWLADLATGSWASLAHHPDARTYSVRQHGPRMLWDEIEAGHRWWTQHGRPELTRFGVSIACGEQRVWIDSPENLVEHGRQFAL